MANQTLSIQKEVVTCYWLTIPSGKLTGLLIQKIGQALSGSDPESGEFLQEPASVKLHPSGYSFLKYHVHSNEIEKITAALVQFCKEHDLDLKDPD